MIDQDVRPCDDGEVWEDVQNANVERVFLVEVDKKLSIEDTKNLHLSALCNCSIVLWFVVGISRKRLNFTHDQHAINDST